MAVDEAKARIPLKAFTHRTQRVLLFERPYLFLTYG
jgi:hypothetical protein